MQFVQLYYLDVDVVLGYNVVIWILTNKTHWVLIQLIIFFQIYIADFK